MVSSTNKLTVKEFFALPEGDRPYELINGKAIAKIFPKFFHSRLQKTLLIVLDGWARNKGRVEAEWAIRLQRNDTNWVLVPDFCYVSYTRLSAD